MRFRFKLKRPPKMRRRPRIDLNNAQYRSLYKKGAASFRAAAKAIFELYKKPPRLTIVTKKLNGQGFVMTFAGGNGANKVSHRFKTRPGRNVTTTGKNRRPISFAVHKGRWHPLSKGFNWRGLLRERQQGREFREVYGYNDLKIWEEVTPQARAGVESAAVAVCTKAGKNWAYEIESCF